MAITYVQPRRGMRNVGVRNGTLLFEGVEEGSGVINGKARRFSRRCGKNIYAVSGTDNGNRIVLRGNAPILDQNCQVTRFRSDTLVFTLQQQQFQPPMNSPHQPQPQVGGAQDWYAIAGSFNSERQAISRANQLGGSWYIFNSSHCPNMRPGYWITAMGPLPRRGAQSYADMARRFGAYIKRCN